MSVARTPSTIETKEDYEKALSEMEQTERLSDSGPGHNAATLARLNVLGPLVEAYEGEHFPMPALSPEEFERGRQQLGLPPAEQNISNTVAPDNRHEPLLARRVPREQIVVGRAYVVHARNGGVGVAVEEDGQIGYALNREKFGEHYLFVGHDWAEGPPFGTAIPLSVISTEPPAGDDALLTWLAAQEDEHRAEIDGAWEVVLGHPPGRRPVREPHR